ncbi:MAG: polysaccharide deacetylase family protein [Lachnospiraceae bacterium]|nr:polysaccharide deacetylase family protein [Lachnospiraceae bacterium]
MRKPLLWLISFCFISLSACGLLSTRKTAESAPEITTEYPDPSSDSPSKNSSTASEEAQTTSPESSTSSIDPSTLSNTLMAWWFMKNENHLAPSAQEEIDLTPYDAWYVKKDLKEGEKPVFLTFDCGYENGYTAGMLDVLKKHNAPAAFFLCKHFIKDQPELVKRMKEEGHIVGNHTSNHICMPETDERTIREEIADNASYMKEATGYEMDHFFRPPKGEYSERTLQITKDMGYTTVFWSLAYPDYDVNNQPGADYVVEQFEKYIHPGAIPLIHNVSQSNAEALDTVLTNLEKEGYTFHSLKELSQAKNS